MLNSTEEIKQRLDLAELIGEYVRLKQVGANFKACCPFHNEKTPSFVVSPDKGIWHCFGCGKGGDHFSFIQNIEGVEFPEALRILAGRAGVKLEYHNPEQHNQKTRLLDLNKAVMEHWHQLLLTDTAAAGVREYLSKRQLKPEIIEQFGLGYAADSWDEAIRYLQSQGFTLKEMDSAGVTVAGERGQPYDRFRHRLIFPIRDVHGSVAGFTARKLREEDHGGKYVNSPGTDIYNKSQILYNLDLAKVEIKRLDYAILVEGNMDAIACYQTGTKNTVAISGTALTEEQIKLLKRYTNNIMIAFDADPAGTQANLKGIDLAWRNGLNVKVVSITSGKDPDDLIKEDPAKWRQAVKEAYNFMDYAFKAILANLDLTRVDHKKTAAKKILPLIKNLGDEVEKSHYLRKLSEILGVDEAALSKSLSGLKTVPGPKDKPLDAFQQAAIDQNRLVAEHLLSLLIKFPEQLAQVTNHLEPEMIHYGPAQKLYTELIIYYNKSHHSGESDLLKELEPSNRDYFNQLTLLIGEEFNNPTPASINREILQTVGRLTENHWRKKTQDLNRLLVLAQKSGNTVEMDVLSQQLNEVLKKLR